MSPAAPTAATAKKLRLLVAAEFFPSRIQPWLLNTIEEAVRHGADVRVVAKAASGDGFPPKVHDLGLLPRTSHFATGTRAAALRTGRRFLPGHAETGRAWRGLFRVLARSGRPAARDLLRSAVVGGEPVDLVHAHYLSTAHDYLFVREVFGCPLVVTFHGLSPAGVGMLPPERNARVFERGTFFILNTRFAQRQLESLGCPSEKIRILPQGLRMEEHDFVPRSFPAEGPVVLLTVARFHRDKGHAYALEAVERLVRRGYDVEYRLVGVGPERERLMEQARALGIAERVRFLGQLDDEGLAREYRAAHVFVLPSVRDLEGHHEETQGAVIQEAQASGAIVVSTRTGGIPECVDDGASAFLVPDRDAEALAWRLGWVIDHPARWAEWQHAGRRWVEEHFDMERLGRRLWRIYEEALER